VEKDIVTDHRYAAPTAAEQLNAPEINVLANHLDVLAVDEAERTGGNDSAVEDSQFAVVAANRNNPGQALIRADEDPTLTKSSGEFEADQGFNRCPQGLSR
jgi:hypothetical protein